VHSGLSPRVARVTEDVFRRLSARRGRRIFHPAGIAYVGDVEVGAGIPGTRALQPATRTACTVRFSLGLGLPARLGDFLGLAIRLEADQDVLLATSAAAPPLRFLPLPARSFFGRTYTSLLPFTAAGRRLLVAARVEGDTTGEGDAWTELEDAAGRRPLVITLWSATPLGPWRPIARIETRSRLSDEQTQALRFDAWRCEGGLVPWGWVNRLRDPAYRGSQRGRRER